MADYLVASKGYIQNSSRNCLFFFDFVLNFPVKFHCQNSRPTSNDAAFL